MPREVLGIFRYLKHPRFEVEEWKALHLFGQPGSTFVDVGASVGIITVAMSRIAGNAGHVIACEPNPDTYRLLLETLRLNRCSNVTPLQALVLDTPGTSLFNVSPVGGLGVRSSVAYTDPGGKTVRLPSISLDCLVEAEPRLDYIKIDAEGAELRILTGARKTLESRRPLVQVEVHGRPMRMIGDGVEALFGFMTQCGYEGINLPTMQKLDLNEFLRCSHCHAPDTFTREDMAFDGFGEVLFIPQEKNHLLRGLPQEECLVCQGQA